MILPFIVSTSAYQPGQNWSFSDPPIAAGICRASGTSSLGSNYKDTAFADYWAQWANLPRCAYHFYRYAYDAAGQARYFFDTVSANGFKPGDKFCIDVEDAGTPNAAHIIDFLWQLETLGVTRKDLLIYSRANILNPIPLTADQQGYLVQIKTWMAGYPANADGWDFVRLKQTYQADSRWGECVMVQYAQNVIISGISGGTELNAASDAYLAEWGGSTPSPPTGATMIATGLVKINGLRIRDLPVSGNVIGSLNTNDQIEIEEITPDNWVRFSKWTRGGVVQPQPGPVCWSSAGATNGYIGVTMVGTPPSGARSVLVTVTDGALTGSATVDLK